MKPENVKIISIVSKDNNIYGLGEDSMVYLWRADNHTWQIWG